MDIPTRSRLEQELARHGLRLLGGFVPAAADHLPGLSAGRSVAAVWIAGQVGSEVWPVFSQSTFAHDGLPDPMDRWSQSVGDTLAEAFGGRALYPSDGPPWWPFQQWMARSMPVGSSPMMVRIHPEYGLWHACRFALALPMLAQGDALQVADPAFSAVDICQRCESQPCLQACPVSAYSVAGFAVQACAGHLLVDEGQECREQGCLARRACPVGAQHRYERAHAAFHMAAFANRRRSPEPG